MSETRGAVVTCHTKFCCRARLMVWCATTSCVATLDVLCTCGFVGARAHDEVGDNSNYTEASGNGGRIGFVVGRHVVEM